jgi:hypothetical protein
MTDLETPRPAVARSRSAFNIYAALMFAALAALGTVVGIMWYMNATLTGESNPFFIVQ